MKNMIDDKLPPSKATNAIRESVRLSVLPDMKAKFPRPSVTDIIKLAEYTKFPWPTNKLGEPVYGSVGMERLYDSWLEWSKMIEDCAQKREKEHGHPWLQMTRYFNIDEAFDEIEKARPVKKVTPGKKYRRMKRDVSLFKQAYVACEIEDGETEATSNDLWKIIEDGKCGISKGYLDRVGEKYRKLLSEKMSGARKKGWANASPAALVNPADLTHLGNPAEVSEMVETLTQKTALGS